MKRVIKFRGKCLHSDEWCFGSLVDYEDEEMEIQGFDVFREGFDKWNEISVDPDTVGQFTGMYDCNGKEIYEGDILQVLGNKITLTVVFDKAAFKFAWNDLSSEFFPAEWVSNCTIIGNIYDNPELLKGDAK